MTENIETLQDLFLEAIERLKVKMPHLQQDITDNPDWHLQEIYILTENALTLLFSPDTPMLIKHRILIEAYIGELPEYIGENREDS